MNFSLYIALRYLFSKKTHNAINIISMICASGICVATISLVCTLSVYNGFQRLITNLFNSFDPELKISLVEGKIFDINTAEIQNVKQLDYIDVFAEVIEENALIKNKEKQTAATIKGVHNRYLSLRNPKTVIYAGEFVL